MCERNACWSAAQGFFRGLLRAELWLRQAGHWGSEQTRRGWMLHPPDPQRPPVYCWYWRSSRVRVALASLSPDTSLSRPQRSRFGVGVVSWSPAFKRVESDVVVDALYPLCSCICDLLDCPLATSPGRRIFVFLAVGVGTFVIICCWIFPLCPLTNHRCHVHH